MEAAERGTRHPGWPYSLAMVEPVEKKTPSALAVMGTLAAIVVVLIGMGQFSGIIAPMFFAINLFIAAYPVMQRLVRIGTPRPLATIALGVVVFAILGIFLYMLIWSITSLTAELPKYSDEFWNLYNTAIAGLASLGISQDQVVDLLQSVNPSSFAGLLQSALSQVTSLISLTVIIVTLIFMMVIDSSTFRARNAVLKDAEPRVWKSMAGFTLGVRRYWVVTSIFGLIVAVIDTAALFMLGVPLAAVWGVLSFITNYIPNIGFLIGVIPPALMALLSNGPGSALLVIVLYSAINFVIQSVIQPKFNGDAVGVTATVALLSLMLWSSVLGALGALIALPMTLLAKALLIDQDPGLRWLNVFISNEPKTALAEGGESAAVETLTDIVTPGPSEDGKSKPNPAADSAG